MKNKINKNKLTKINLAYIAGFLDGDGSILAQLVKNDSYIYKFQIRLSIVFYQKTTKHWILLWLKKKLKYGFIRKKINGMSEYCIVSSEPVYLILLKLKPYIKLKKKLLKLILKIIKHKKEIKSIEDFINVCELVDLTSTLIYSKKRKIITEYVKNYINKGTVET